MTGHDVYLLSPEISLVGLALLVMGLDLFVRRKGLLTLVAVVGLALPMALSIVLWMEVSSEADGRLVGVLGALTVDKFALFFKFLIVGVTGLVLAASMDYARRMPGLRGEFIGLILLSATGMTLLASAAELITIYVSLELTALPLIALSTFLMTPRSGEAGLKFLVLSGVSSALLLYGMVLVYGFTGTTYLEEIGRAVATPMDASIPFGSVALLVGGHTDSGGVWVQDCGGAVPHVGAGRVPGGADAGSRVPVGGEQGGGVCHSAEGILYGVSSFGPRVVDAVCRACGGVDDAGQPDGDGAEQHQAAIGLQHRGARGVYAGGAGGGGVEDRRGRYSRRAWESAFLPGGVCGYEHDGILCGDGRVQQAGYARN